jgi:hypothetical protein
VDDVLFTALSMSLRAMYGIPGIGEEVKEAARIGWTKVLMVPNRGTLEGNSKVPHLMPHL